jgi:hypothetical protein
MPEGLQIVVSPDVVGRGGCIGVSVVGERDGLRSLRAELVLTERKKIANLYKRTHERVLANAELANSDASVDLMVPDWAPDTYSGDSIDWDYSVRVIGDRLGPDFERAETIRVAGGAMVPYERGPLNLLRSYPARLARSAMTGTEPRAPGWVPLALFAVVGVAVLVGYVFDSEVAMAICAMFVIVPLAYLYVWLTGSPIDMSDLVLTVPEEPLRLGTAACITVANPSNLRLEIGIRAIEVAVTKSKHSYAAHTEVVVERFEPLTGSEALLPIGEGDPPGYAGEQIALHWIALARALDHTTTVGGRPWVGVPIGVVA